MRRSFGVRVSRARGVVAVLAAVSLLTVLPVLPLAGGARSVARADGSGTSSSPQPSAETVALQKASQDGERVEVTDERTPYATTYANPDGKTLTLEQSVVPVRVKAADGSWTTPDATLVTRADGTVGPKASVMGLAFSGGGDGSDLVDISQDGRSLSLGWTGALPEPSLDGASATYADVLPGVDLRMTATAEGFREVLVVKTPQAAANPALSKVTFALHAKGLTVQPAVGGGMTAVDSDDAKPVFSAPAALMWDSQGDAAPAESQTSRSTATADAGTSEPNATAAAEPQDDDPTAGPGEGDASAVLPVQVDNSSLSVVPDPGMLANSDSSAFPLYIDPSVGLSQTARIQIRSDGYSDYNFDNGSNNEGKGVGQCSSYDGFYCGPGYTERIYYQFSPSTLTGKKVLDATFRDTESWSFTCDAAWVDLERTSNITSGTTWAGRPSNLGVVASRDVSAGRDTACSPSQPAAPIEFHDSRLTDQVSDFAAGQFDRLTLLIKARDETATSDWKRFRDDAVMSVTYVGYPAVPTNAGLVSGSGVTCEPNASDPQVTGDPTPDITAKISAVSGGGSGASMRAHFLVQKQAGDGTWAMATEPIRPLTGFISSGSTETDPSPITLDDGGLYRFAAFARSYYDGSSYLESHSTVTTTGWCYFKIDTTAPKAPVVTAGSPYSACTQTACVAAGGPGVQATFTFGPASGDVNTGYEYKLASSATWSSVIPGNNVTQPIAPQLAGTQLLLVRAEDAAGWGETQPFMFNVQEGEGPIGLWHFNDGAPNSGVTLAHDTATVGSRHNATLYTAGAGWSGFGRLGDGDTSLWLNDTTNPASQTGYAATSLPAVNTESSFTVSAWAYLAEDSDYQTVTSEVGSDNSGFLLYYSPGIHKWVFRWDWDVSGTHTFAAVNADTANAPLKVWTHLTGVYDASARTISLYVNGRLQGGGPVTLPSASDAHATDGLLEFGRGSFVYDSFTNYLHGRVDEVSVWQRALPEDEIKADDHLLDASNNPATELVADWDPDGASGTTLTDTTSLYARSLGLTGGASLDGQSIVLDGTSGAATTAGPVVDGTGSFTVTTLVDPDSAALAGKPIGYTAQVLGQRSTGGSAWGLWYQLTSTVTEPDPDGGPDLTVPHGVWWFGRLDAAGFHGVSSDEPAELGSPVRLTGVYDAPSGALHFYVGGNENTGASESTPYTADPGSGLFTAGEGQIAGDSGMGHFLPGRIDDIRLWAGAMSNAQQINTAVGD